MNTFFFALSLMIFLATNVKSAETLPTEKTDLLTFLKKNRRKDIDQDFLKTVKLMIENGADVNQSKKGGSPFEEALHRKNVDLTKMMIEAKAIITEDHLCHSNLRSDPDIINLFLSHGAPLNPKKCNLFYANLDFNFKVAKILLEKGATIPPIDQATGDSFVHHIVRHGRGAKKEEFTQFLDYLISKKIDIALKNKWGQTPLFYFAVGYTTDDNNYTSDPYGIVGPISKTDYRDGQGDEDYKSYYLISKYSAEQLNQVDDFGNTAIHALASIPLGHKNSNNFDEHTCPLELFKTYKAQGGKIGLVNKLGYSPLHICKGYFNLKDLSETLKLFSKDELNQQDLEGNTALHSQLSGIMKLRPDLVKMFISHGARKDIKNKLNLLPYDLVKNTNNKSEFEFLKP